MNGSGGKTCIGGRHSYAVSNSRGEASGDCPGGDSPVQQPPCPFHIRRRINIKEYPVQIAEARQTININIAYPDPGIKGKGLVAALQEAGFDGLQTPPGINSMKGLPVLAPARHHGVITGSLFHQIADKVRGQKRHITGHDKVIAAG